MLHSPEPSPIQLSAENRSAFERDGVICVRGLYSATWVSAIARALDEICSIPTPFGQKDAKFRSDVYCWSFNDIIRDFVLFGPSADLARQAFASTKVNFFYDQIFVKEEMTPDPTPWHHDLTFWPLQGDQIASLWTSVDPVCVDSSGLEFVAGSHRWPQRFKPVGAYGIVMSDGDFAAPDIENQRDKYRILSWDLEPGDALLFHALTVHGSRGNRSRVRKRRALTTRWCGDGVIFSPSNSMPIPWRHDLQPGDLLSGPLFPQVWPELDQAAVAQRMAGPVPPDPEMAAQAMQRLARAERVPVKMDDLGLTS